MSTKVQIPAAEKISTNRQVAEPSTRPPAFLRLQGARPGAAFLPAGLGTSAVVASQVHQIQRSHGNRAVGMLLSDKTMQRKRTAAAAPVLDATGQMTIAREPNKGAVNDASLKMAVQKQPGTVIVSYEGAGLLSIFYDSSKGIAQTDHFRNSDGAEMVQVVLPPQTARPDRSLDPRYNQLHASGELTLSEIEPEDGSDDGYLYGLATRPTVGSAAKPTPAASPPPAAKPVPRPAPQPAPQTEPQPEKPPAKSADELIDAHTTLRFLDEEKLGAELLKYAAIGDAATVNATLDKLDSTDRDDVAVALVAAASDKQLQQMASTDEGRKLLLRLYDELSSGHLGEDEAKQAERVMQASAQQIDPQQFIEAESKATVIPFSSVGFTKLSSASLTVKRLDNGNIWVRSYMKPEHWQNAKRLPSMDLVINGIELNPNQVVGLYLYDEGGKTVYVPAIYLLQVGNQEDTKVLTMIGEAVVTGATLGFGGGGVAGGEAAAGSWAARGLTVLRWADHTATAVMAASTVINDHRGLILKQFGKDGEEFLKHWSTVERVVAIYGLARGAVALGQTVNALRASYKNWRALRSQAKNLAAEEQKALDEIAQQAENSLKELEGAQQSGAKAALPKGINDETAEMLTKRPELRNALAKNPRAANALTLCKSPCIPEFATASQVDRIESLLAQAEKRGLQLDQRRLKRYFHSAKDEASLTKAIDDFEAKLSRSRPNRRALPSDAKSDEVGDVFEELTEGTGRKSPSDPEELVTPDSRRTAELQNQPLPQKPSTLLQRPESVAAAKAAGIPDEVIESGTVFTRKDFSELVPDQPIPAGKPAPEILPEADELRRGVAGRRPTTAPDPRDVQHTELLGDIELTRSNLQKAGGRIEEVAINRTQRTGPSAAPTRASAHTRPDVQIAVIDAKLNGKRILIEYDRAPGTRAIAHAQGILTRDPDAIVIIKIIGFD